MAVCSFLGHNGGYDKEGIYDVDIQDRLRAAVDRVVNKNNTVEFLMYQRGPFFDRCLLAVLEAKTRYPGKVTVSVVVDGETKIGHDYPPCIVDKMVPLPLALPVGNNVAQSYKSAVRFLIQQSTHLISCLYEPLLDTENLLLYSARRKKDLEIIDISNEQTVEAILEFATQLPDKEQLVFQKLNGGCTLKEAGALLGVGPERVRQIKVAAFHKLRKALEHRYYWAEKERNPPALTCCIVSTGTATYERLRMFEKLLRFIMERYGIIQFYITGDLCHSPYLYVLRESYQASIRCQKPRITAVVTDSMCPESEDELAMFCPPCDAVERIGLSSAADAASFDVLSHMIARSDFCICDLSEFPLAYKILEEISCTKQKVLVNIGQEKPVPR